MRLLTPWWRLGIGASAAVILTVVGVIGYIAIEGFSFFDALYQTVTTITTAGFGEVRPLGRLGRVFTIILIVFGIIVILYVLTAVMQIAVEGEIESIFGRRRMRAKIENLRDHYILCGFGRVGEEIARDFVDRGMPFVVVETNPEAIARAGHRESEPRMLRAGAERVFSPYIIAGRRMALSALQPLVVDFIETLATARQGEQILAEIEISSESGLAGQSIHDVLHACQSLVVLGLQKPTGEIQVGPRGTLRLEEGDRLIVLGDEAELESIRPAAGQPKREAVS